MNELTQSPGPGAPARGHQGEVSTGQATARVLQGAYLLEEPWRLSEALTEEHPGWYRAVFGEMPTLEGLRHPHHADAYRQRIDEMLELLPPQAEAAAVVSSILKLSSQEPDRRQTLALIAAMVAGFPNGRPSDPEAYIQGLLHEVMIAGHKPGIVARATRLLARKSKFLPNLSEVLEACNEAAGILRSIERLVDAQGRRSSLELMLSEADRLGPRDLDAEWREKVKAFVAGEPWKDFVGTEPGGPRCRVPAHILAEFALAPLAADDFDEDGARKIPW